MSRLAAKYALLSRNDIALPKVLQYHRSELAHVSQYKLHNLTGTPQPICRKSRNEALILIKKELRICLKSVKGFVLKDVRIV